MPFTHLSYLSTVPQIITTTHHYYYYRYCDLSASTVITFLSSHSRSNPRQVSLRTMAPVNLAKNYYASKLRICNLEYSCNSVCVYMLCLYKCTRHEYVKQVLCV